MKSVLILSRDKKVIDAISAAVQTSGFQGKIQIVGSDMLLLVRLADLEHVPPSGVFIDLETAGDSIRLVEWLRFSSRMRKLRIVAIGEESTTLKIFRDAWGAASALIKPLNTVAMELAVAKLKLAGEVEETGRNEMRQKLLEAVDRSKELRAERERLIRHLDLLSAELKDKKMPFKRRGKEQEPPLSRQESA